MIALLEAKAASLWQALPWPSSPERRFYNIDGGSSERPRSSSERSRTFNASDDSDSCA
jgi:hypothetical protein